MKLKEIKFFTVKTIKYKLVLSFLSILVLCIGSIFLFYINILNLNSNIEKSNINTQAIIQINRSSEELRSNQMAILFQTDKNAMDSYMGIYNLINKHLGILKQNTISDGEVQALDNIEFELKKYNDFLHDKVTPFFENQYKIYNNSLSFSLSSASEVNEPGSQTNNKISNNYSQFLNGLEKKFETSRNNFDIAKSNQLNEEGKYIIKDIQEKVNALENIYLHNNSYSLTSAKRNSTLISVLLILTLLIIGIGLSFAMSGLIAKSIKTFVERMKIVEKGDFTIDFNENSQGEFKFLGTSFNTMVETLKSLILSIKQTSSALGSHSYDMKEIVLNTENKSNRILENNNDMLNKLDQTSTMLINSNSAMLDICSSASQINIGGNQLLQGSKAIANIASNSREISNEVYEKISNINDINKEVNEAVNYLLNNSKKIEKVVDTIKEIANRTKLIAINASIEAARLGSDGMGFSVIAEEIKKLSEQSSESTKDVYTITKGIQHEIENVLQHQALSDSAIQETVEFTSRTKEEMNKISNETAKFFEIVSEITKVYSNFSNNLTDVSCTVSQSGEVFKNAQDKIQSNISLTNNIADEIKKISDLSENIDKISYKLNDLISYFKIYDNK